MSYEAATLLTKEISGNAVPVLQVTSFNAARGRWCRNVADDDDRRGPWRVPVYKVLDQAPWEERAPCLYVVNGSDGGHRYVGVSKNRLKDRWRLSPAFDETGSRPLGIKHLFHSRCWPEMEGEFDHKPGVHFEVRVCFVPSLKQLLSRLSEQRTDLPSVTGVSDEAAPGVVEKWLRGYRKVSLGVSFLPWNKN